MIGFPAGISSISRFIVISFTVLCVWAAPAHAAVTVPAQQPAAPALTAPAAKQDSSKTTARHIPATGVSVSQKKDTAAKVSAPAAGSRKDILKEVIQEPSALTDTAKKDSGDIYLTVKSVPESAEVFIDGLAAGATPYETGNLRSGTHTVELKAEGFRDFRKEIYFAPLSRKKITVRMASIYSSLSLRSVPSGAEVSMNGAKTGVTPLDMTKLVPDTFDIAFSLANYLPYHAQLITEQNKSDTVTAVLVSKAYADSVKAAEKKHRQLARRIIFGIAFSGFTLAGVLVNQTAQNHLNKESEARTNYDNTNSSIPDAQAKLDAYWAEYKSERSLATSAMQKRNVLYGIAGVFAIGVGFSIPF